jgi:hypothetical protein
MRSRRESEPTPWTSVLGHRNGDVPKPRRPITRLRDGVRDLARPSRLSWRKGRITVLGTALSRTNNRMISLRTRRSSRYPRSRTRVAHAAIRAEA